MVHTVNVNSRAEARRESKPPIGKVQPAGRGPLKGGGKSQTIKVRRLQIKLSDRAYERLESVRELTDAVSAVEVIRDALRVYEALVQAVSAGKEIIAEDPKRPTSRERLRLW